MNESFSSRVLLECCVGSVEDAIFAEQGGADRIELNLSLESGGLTPSIGLFKEVFASVSLPVLPIIRPRTGGFRYSATEQKVILSDAERLLEEGASGIVTGCLTGSDLVPESFWAELRKLVGPRELVFHRAMDVVADLDELLDQLIALGTDRVLTSGGCSTALRGAGNLKRLVGLAGSRIEILAAAGVSAANVIELVRKTDCRQVHGSFRKMVSDPAGVVGEDRFSRISLGEVLAVRGQLDKLI